MYKCILQHFGNECIYVFSNEPGRVVGLTVQRCFERADGSLSSGEVIFIQEYSAVYNELLQKFQ